MSASGRIRVDYDDDDDDAVSHIVSNPTLYYVNVF